VERIGVNDNFFELGGHSLLGLRFVNQLREALGEHVALGMVFEAPTPARMAIFLEDNFPKGIARWLGKSTAPSSAGRPLPSITPVDRESRRAQRPDSSGITTNGHK